MKKRNFLMMLGLLGFGATANAQVIASLGFEEGEEQKYLNPDSVSKYPDWSADHINLGLEDAWTEENADDVHSGSYALRAGNAGLSWSNSTTGNLWDRAIKMRGLEIEPETSYRVTFWAKAPATYTSSDGASTGMTAIKSTLSVGIENVEAPFVSQSGTEYYYNWTGSEDVPVFEDDWKCFSFVAYYSGKEVQNKVFDNYNNNIKEIIENDPDDTTDNDTIYWGQDLTGFPDEFFLTINMYNPVEYLLDDIKIEKATMAGCFYDYNGIRIDLGYPTNLDDLAKASSDPVEGTVLFPNEWVTVKYGDQVLEISSLEGKSDGCLYIFFDEAYLEETIGYLGDDPEVIENITISFNPTADCAIKYDTDQRPSMDVESEMTVLPFTDEKLLAMEYFQEESYLNAGPEFVSSVPENRSFDLDGATFNQVKMTFNRPVDVSMSSATLYSTDDGSTVASYTGAEGISVDPEDEYSVIIAVSGLADGGYRMVLSGLRNAASGSFSTEDAELIFTIGEDTSVGVTENIYVPDFSQTANGTFPVGWVSYCSDGPTIHEYGLNADSTVWNYDWGGNKGGGGSRMYGGFSGDFTKAIYWGSRGVTTTDEISTLTYGAQVENYMDESGNISPDMDPRIALYLEPKKHELSFLMAAWKGEPTFDFTLETLDGEVVAEFRDQVAKPNVNGVQGEVTGSLELVTEFTPPKEGYYVLKFATKPGIGWSELLLAKVSLITKPSDAAYYKTLLSAAVDSAQHVMTDSIADAIYDGTTKAALQAAIVEAQETKFTAPSAVEAMNAKLYDLCGQALARKAGVDRYDVELLALQNAVGAIDAASKYATSADYINGVNLANEYMEVSSSDLEDEELFAAVDDFVLNKNLLGNVKSCVDALTYRLTKAAETAERIGVAQESAIMDAKNTLTDNDEIAEGLNGHIKYRLYEILAAGEIPAEMKDTIYSETEDDATTVTGKKLLAAGVDLTSFVKNPEFYTYLKNASDTVRSENTPGWDLMYGYVHVNGDAEGLVTDSRPVADNCLNSYMNNYKIGQSVSGLPVGKYKVHMRTRTATQTDANGGTFVMNAVNDTTGIPDKYMWIVSSDKPSDTIRVEFAAGATQYPIHSWGGYPTVTEQEITVNENTVLTFGVVEHYKSYGNHYFRDPNNNNAWTLYPDSIGGNWDTNCYADEARLIFVAPLEGYDYSAGLTGIDEVEAAAEAVKREFYTVDGIKVERPRKGVFIVKTYYADGTVKVETKVMK